MSADEAADPFFDDRPWTNFAEGAITCPQCSKPVPVPVLARMNGESEQRLETQADMTEVWSHAWTHDEGAARAGGGVADG